MEGGVVEVPKDEEGTSGVRASELFDFICKGGEGGGTISLAKDIDVNNQYLAERDCKALKVAGGERDGLLKA